MLQQDFVRRACRIVFIVDDWRDHIEDGRGEPNSQKVARCTKPISGRRGVAKMAHRIPNLAENGYTFLTRDAPTVNVLSHNFCGM